MQFYIKELSERTVALMLGTGQVLAYFPSVLEAAIAIKEWYQFNDLAPQDEIMLGTTSGAITRRACILSIISVSETALPLVTRGLLAVLHRQ